MKTDDVFSELGKLDYAVYQRSPPWPATRIFFCYDPLNSGKCHPGKEIFESMTLYNTHKSPLRNIFFFVINLVGLWN